MMQNNVHDIVKQALAEDLGGKGDITTNALVAADLKSRAKLIARVDGVLCGVEPARASFEQVDGKLVAVFHKKDGDLLKAGDCIADISGATRSILTAERTALNFLTHLSGIASLTSKFVKEVEGTKAKVICTRKTIPGLRALEKYAVRMGGATNHRFGLHDAVLIKDNHLAVVGTITEAVRLARASVGKSVKVEVEVDSLIQLEEALLTSADVIMLDNFDVAMIKAAVKKAAGAVPLEVSGGVNLQNIHSIAETGVDFISVGALTHSAPALDIALDF